MASFPGLFVQCCWISGDEVQLVRLGWHELCWACGPSCQASCHVGDESRGWGHKLVQ